MIHWILCFSVSPSVLRDEGEPHIEHFAKQATFF
jgi:hypothetical protein